MPNILYKYRINISDCINQDIKMTEISVEKKMKIVIKHQMQNTTE